ncbi:hypothetical protein ACJX0J_025346, partial [Zea mays]
LLLDLRLNTCIKTVSCTVVYDRVLYNCALVVRVGLFLHLNLDGGGQFEFLHNFLVCALWPESLMPLSRLVYMYGIICAFGVHSFIIGWLNLLIFQNSNNYLFWIMILPIRTKDRPI